MSEGLTTTDYELRAGRNIIWGVIGQVVLRLLGFVYFIFISSRLLESGMGKYGFIGSFVVMWFIFSDFGIGGYLFREWSKKEKPFSEIENDFYHVFTIRLLMASIVFLPFLVINYFVNKEILLALALAYFSTFLAIFASLADSFLQSNNQVRNISIRTMLEKLVIVIFGGVLIYVWPRVEMIFVATIIAQVVSLLYYYATVLPFKFRFIFDWQKTKDLARKGLPFVFITLFMTIYSRIDIVMLRFMDNFDSVGWYNTAYRFIDLAAVFSATLFVPAIFTILSALYAKKEAEQFNDFLYKALRIVFSSSLMMMLFVIFFAPLLVSLLFPSSFMPSVLALRILILVQISSSIGMLFNSLLLIQNRERIGLKIIIFSACFNIVLNLFLIPRYSLYGAAWATVIAEGINIYLLQRYALWNKNFSFLMKAAGILLFNAAILLALKYAGLLNNMYYGGSVLLLNLVIIFFSGLLKRGDLELFTDPVKLKFNNYFNHEIL
jgi:O-antigen/teichoic acid export membrane protein